MPELVWDGLSLAKRLPATRREPAQLIEAQFAERALIPGHEAGRADKPNVIGRQEAPAKAE